MGKTIVVKPAGEKECGGGVVKALKERTNSDRNHAKFIARNIVRKKKNPQKTLQKYFPVVKPKQINPERNFQGFPLTECVFEEELDQFLFRPPWYGNKENSDGSPHQLCRHCLLRPCIVFEKWDQIIEFCEEAVVCGNVDDSEGMYSKLLNHAQSTVASIFGPRYVRNNPDPNCLLDVVGRYHRIGTYHEMGNETGEEDWYTLEDDLVAGATDREEYKAPHPWHQPRY